jgi:SAM-dependent methyltransferase
VIRPEEIIDAYSVAELNRTADDYYASLVDPAPQMAKPFADLLEAPLLLQNVGHVLAGLRLGKTMTVLDFAAGTCWFSRFLNQLQCRTISCDVSATALEIGRRLFEEHPIVGEPIAAPVFLHFDGHTLDLPAASVDRIVCLDGFHHVPNQEEVLAELARVLKPGGIAAFSEPGPFHSRSAQSQYEMKNYRVLENDIVISDIATVALRHGFTACRVRLLSDMEVAAEEWQLLTAGRSDRRWRSPVDEVRRLRLLRRVAGNVGATMRQRTIFFLNKGEWAPDSRSHVGLSHTMRAENTGYRARVGERLAIPLRIANSGSAKWLTSNVKDIGVVRVGTHLYDQERRLLDLDFSRHDLAGPVAPGERLAATIELQFERRGVFHLAIDLVAEGVCWFENVGAEPVWITVEVG